jgi:hypothetical protein
MKINNDLDPFSAPSLLIDLRYFKTEINLYFKSIVRTISNVCCILAALSHSFSQFVNQIPV